MRTRRRLRPAVLMVTLVTAWLAVGVGAARAQERDPFDPLVGESAGTTTTVPAGGATVQPAPVEQPAPPAPAPAEQLPATGSDATRFVVVGLALVCAGAGITIVSRCFGTRAVLTAFGSPRARGRRPPPT